MVAGFDQLASSDLEHVASVSAVVEVGQGEVLFREGAAPESLYVLFEGHVSLTGTAADSTIAVIDILGPNRSFVLANVLTGELYLIGAEVVVPSVMLTIPAEPMRAMVAARPPAAMAMMRAVSGELSAMTRQVIDLKVRIAAQRLGSYLLNLVDNSTAKTADFRLPVNKGLLASWLGCRPENLSRAFTGLRAYGVETHGSRVTLHDIARLKTYAGSLLPEGDTASPADAGKRPPVERILGDAFRLRTGRPRGE